MACPRHSADCGGSIMEFPRRAFLHLAVGAAALPAVPRLSWAQAYPSRPVRIVVGFAAGGATDIQARLMGQWLSDHLGQQFIVENRAGASGNIGTEAVAKAAPRRLHAAADRDAARDQRRALQQSQFRLHPGHRAGDLRRAAGLCGRGASVGPRQDDPGVHRLRQGQPGQDQLRLGRPRHPAKHCVRTLQDDGRRGSGPRPVSRRRACGHRSGRRPSAGDFRAGVGIDPAHPGRQAARAGGHDRGPSGRVAGRSHGGGFRARL